MHLKYWLIHTVVLIFVFLFTYTGLAKLREHELFLSALRTTIGVEKLANILAWAIPSLELSFVVLLLFRQTQRLGLLGCASLMAIFTGYVGAFLLRWVNVPCSCGGIIKALDWNVHFGLNLILTVFAFVAAKTSPPSKFDKLFMRIIRSSRTPV